MYQSELELSLDFIQLGKALGWTQYRRFDMNEWPKLITLIVFTGCSVGPDFTSPRAELPKSWDAASEASKETGEGQLKEWWKRFNDPQ